MKKLALLLALALAVLCCCPALADVQKGDRGEEVRYLQWLLQQTGWLNESPDGAFGNHTEQAVMDYQAAKGLEPTGVADAALMQQMDMDRVAQDRETHGADYYAPYTGNFVPPFDMDYTAPSHCITTVLRDMLYRDACRDHLALLEQEYALTATEDAAGYAEAAELWRKDVEAQYAAWAEASPTGRQAVEAAGAAWADCFAAQYGAMNASWTQPALAERQLMLMMKYYAGTLGELRSGAMPAPADPDMLVAEGSIEPDEFCETWAINGGTEFVTGCAEHAPLLGREYEWSLAGGEDAGAIAGIAGGWEQALAALYERWAALTPDSAGAVNGARDAFLAALDAQDAALSGSDVAPLARMEVVQLECMRLCGLLNHEIAVD